MIVAAIIALLAAWAVPVWQKIRLRSLCSIMDNDARQLESAAQQYYMENSTNSVAAGYVNGAITGPLSERVHFIGSGYSSVSSPLVATDNFSITHPAVSEPRYYSPEGKYQP